MVRKVIIVAAVLTGVILFSGFLFHDKLALVFQDENTAAACPDPLVLKTPVDLSLVTSILYPGQIRGGDFKPHGGFRFDNSKNNDIEVYAPITSVLVGASRYLEQGEVQYLFDFETSCGIKYRFDHLLTLSPKFKEVVESLPAAREHDSRTTGINRKITVSTGEVIATGVGIESNNNVFVDFGVFKSSDLPFQNPRGNGMCWFDLLSEVDSIKVKSLPAADSQSGATSAFCK